MADRIKLNSRGMDDVAKSREVRAEINKLAERVADNVRSQGIRVGDKDGGSHEYALPVKVVEQTTDRARASVTIAHPAGLSVQGKHGALTKAAAQAGLEVKGR